MVPCRWGGQLARAKIRSDRSSAKAPALICASSLIATKRSTSSHPPKNLLTSHAATLFKPERGDQDADACSNSVDIGGFYGPWIDVDGYYTGPLRKLPLEQRLLAKAYEEFIHAVSRPRVEREVFDIVQKVYPDLMRPPLVNSFDKCLQDSSTS